MKKIKMLLTAAAAICMFFLSAQDTLEIKRSEKGRIKFASFNSNATRKLVDGKSFKYMSYKDSKEFCADLKEIYQAVNLNQAEQKFQSVKDKWGAQYRIVIKSWENNWEGLTVFFQYPPDIRRLMYTTNPVEGFNRQMRKATKTKGAFVSDTALMKILYLATCNATEKWTMPIHNWNRILNALILNFGDRIEHYLKE